MRKILFVLDSLGLGGAERVAVHAAKHFSRNHEVLIVCPPAPRLQAFIESMGLSVHSPPALASGPRWRRIWWLRRTVVSICNDFNPEVIHYNSLRAVMV